MPRWLKIAGVCAAAAGGIALLLIGTNVMHRRACEVDNTCMFDLSD